MAVFSKHYFAYFYRCRSKNDVRKVWTLVHGSLSDRNFPLSKNWQFADELFECV